MSIKSSAAVGILIAYCFAFAKYLASVSNGGSAVTTEIIKRLYPSKPILQTFASPCIIALGNPYSPFDST